MKPWAERAKKSQNVFMTSLILLLIPLALLMWAHTYSKAVYHPSCSLFRKLGIVDEPITLLQKLRDCSYYRLKSGNLLWLRRYFLGKNG